MSWQIGSMVILLLALLAGMIWYERMRPPSQIVALVAVLAALAVAGRILLAPLPNVMATTDIVLIAGYVLGPAPGFAVGALGALVSNFWLGQGAWTPWQMVGWGMTGVAGGLLWWMTRGKAGRVRLAIACGLAGLVFGAWMNLQTMVSYGGEMSLERYLVLEVRAIPFDLAHIFGNVIFALLAGPALVAALRRFRERFEWRAAAPVVPVLLACLLITGLALQPTRAEADSTGPVKNAKRWLTQQINPDGGFGMTPGDDSSLDMTAWVMLGLGKVGADLNEVKSTNGNTPYKYLAGNRGRINDAATLAKAILAIKSANGNPRSLNGMNLVKKLERKVRDNPTSGGKINTAAFTVMALRKVEAGRDEVVDTERWICRSQNNDGGWGISGKSKSDTDSTGVALQVVGGKGFKGKAIGYLADQQVNNGGFTNGFSGSNSQSTALAVQGMLGARYAAESMSRGGNTAIQYLERRQNSDRGYITYNGDRGKNSSIWVTAQALPSLAKNDYFGGTPRDCNDFVKGDSSAGGGTGGADSGGSGSSGSGSGSGSGGSFTFPGTTGGSSSGGSPGGGFSDGSGTGGGSGSGGGFGNGSGGFDGSGSGNGGGSQGGSTGSGTPVPNVVDPVVPVVPDAALLAASAAGPEPSVPLAIAIFLAVSGTLIGGTMWLVRRFSW